MQIYIYIPYFFFTSNNLRQKYFLRNVHMTNHKSFEKNIALLLNFLERILTKAHSLSL